MSRPTEQQLEQRRWSRTRPGPRRFLRGPTWTMGDYSTSKQVSKQAVLRIRIKFVLLDPNLDSRNQHYALFKKLYNFNTLKIC